MSNAARSRTPGRRYRETRADRYERQAAALLETVGHLRALLDARIQSEAELQAALDEEKSRNGHLVSALRTVRRDAGWFLHDFAVSIGRTLFRSVEAKP